MIDEAAVHRKLNEIRALDEEYQRARARLYGELIQMARNFESYGEMYGFIKKNTPDLKAFCDDMMAARELTGL